MNYRRNALISLFLFLISGCGGGGSSSSPPATPNPSGGGAPPSPVASDIIFGAITGFGSIFVDGRRFDTTGADISKDGVPAAQSDLRIGMVVELRGDLSTNSATSVKFEEDVKGPVDEINGDELVVLGQTVRITPTTVLDDSLDLATLNVGDVLEISGLRDENDAIEASFVEDKDASDVNAFKVIGRVRDLDTTAQTFRVGGLTVDYSVARLDDFSEITQDQLVEVKDENKAYSPGDGTLIATKIESAGLAMGDGARVRIEGLITEILDTDRFTLAGIEVRHTTQTQFLFGDAALLAVGAKVRVEGRRADDGSIDATKIKFSRNSARIEGVVDGTDIGAGVVTVFGVTVEIGAGTRLEDKRDDVEPFTVADLLAGDFVELRGTSAGDRVLASRLRRDDNDNDTRLRGPAMNVDAAAQTLSILGVAIVISSATQFEDLDDQRIDAQTFFDLLNDGQTLVQAKWDGAVVDPTVAVRELSLED